MNEPAPAPVRQIGLVPIEFGLMNETGCMVVVAAKDKAILGGASREDSVKLANDILNWTAPPETPAS